MTNHTSHDPENARTPADLAPVEQMLDRLAQRDRDAAAASMESRIVLRTGATLRATAVSSGLVPLAPRRTAHRVTLALAAVLALALSLGVALTALRAPSTTTPMLADADTAPLADEEGQWALVLAVLESPLDGDLDDLRARSDLLNGDVSAREDASDWLAMLEGTL
ncbi:MAG: hypothetical protein RBS39_11030 [Phycisphaerales bacterium]|jgi:hypothetical protein|nr:hypothetical protein [Phycisphaerales bacterium]